MVWRKFLWATGTRGERQQRYFLTVAEERQFARAAARLLIAAPSLSQQTRALERELHVPLFVRSARSVELTPADEVLLARARVILSEADGYGPTSGLPRTGTGSSRAFGSAPWPTASSAAGCTRWCSASTASRSRLP